MREIPEEAIKRRKIAAKEDKESIYFYKNAIELVLFQIDASLI